MLRTINGLPSNRRAESLSGNEKLLPGGVGALNDILKNGITRPDRIATKAKVLGVVEKAA
ncbi:MAG: hypothetical protein N4A36_04280 [Candidatus Gracilibacteria bacterium]|jgi:hypothetical protein|nr:hypothetical protein [Candidatus Gracilibacteria bacterium]